MGRATVEPLTPDCMTPEELALWQQRPYAGPWTEPCRDCPLWFSVEMKAKGCCNGIPGQSPAGRPFMRATRPKRYATQEERTAARRKSWREGYERRQARLWESL